MDHSNGAATLNTEPMCTNSSNSGSQGNNPESGKLHLQICPSTGGQFDLEVSARETIDGLKKIIAKRLKVPKERISLLYRDRLLKEGGLVENGISSGCRLTLLPNVEAGLMTQRPDHTTVMQALENLSEGQVNDFLAGKAPLTLAMRLGDHMMFVQLQLSTTPPNSKRMSSSRASNLQKPSQKPSPSSSTSTSTSTSSQKIECQKPAAGAVPLPATILDSSALAEASRNLSQKLKELSKASSTPVPEAKSPPTPKGKSGAIIESMHHHGQGVYSGTFSGTLNPALQDRDGKPRRNISTIVHILNDLLGASPQYRAHLNAHNNNHPKRERPVVPPVRRVTRPMPRMQAQAPVLSKMELHKRLSEVERMRLCKENRATRGKMEQLQVMMEERRMRRKARRESRAPYSTWLMGKNIDSDSSSEHSMDMDSSDLETSLSDQVEAHDSATYTELKQETIVA